MTLASPPSMTQTTELVVPRSIPMIFSPRDAMISSPGVNYCAMRRPKSPCGKCVAASVNGIEFVPRIDIVDPFGPSSLSWQGPYGNEANQGKDCAKVHELRCRVV